jgi:hypothetical protein
MTNSKNTLATSSATTVYTGAVASDGFVDITSDGERNRTLLGDPLDNPERFFYTIPLGLER